MAAFARVALLRLAGGVAALLFAVGFVGGGGNIAHAQLNPAGYLISAPDSAVGLNNPDTTAGDDGGKLWVDVIGSTFSGNPFGSRTGMYATYRRVDGVGGVVSGQCNGPACTESGGSSRLQKTGLVTGKEYLIYVHQTWLNGTSPGRPATAIPHTGSAPPAPDAPISLTVGAVEDGETRATVHWLRPTRTETFSLEVATRDHTVLLTGIYGGIIGPELDEDRRRRTSEDERPNSPRRSALRL